MYVCQTVSLGVRGDFRAVTCDVLYLTILGPQPPSNMFKLVQLGLSSQPLPPVSGYLAYIGHH